MKEYLTVADIQATCEIVIDKSRFIANCIHIDSVQEATEFIQSIRKKYFDATHNCYAYVCGDRVKFSDDGEPQGTAGIPICECIKNNNLDYICVVVTRYFGGIKLGAGGLVRAYSSSTAQVISATKKVAMKDCTEIEVAIEYSLVNPLRRSLQNRATEINAVYADNVTLVYQFPTVLYDTITQIVSESTLGKAKIKEKQRCLLPFTV